MTTRQLTGKVAFITGGSRGMGAAIVRRLSAEGATIAFTHSGRNRDKAEEVLQTIKADGSSGIALTANNVTPGAVVDAMKIAIDTYGKIDILINNAGIYTNKHITEFTLAEYDEMMDVNVKAVFLASQFAARHMNEGGRIITIGSNLAERVPAGGDSLYAMSKSALIGLTKGMARDLGARAITVNLLQPGPVDTDMNPADGAHAPFLRKFMAIDRYGDANEIASMVAYLSGPDAQFVTGSSITVDGGLNI